MVTKTCRVPTASGKPGKMVTVFQPGKILEFCHFAKYPGKMRQTLEILGLLTVILHGNASPKTYQLLSIRLLK